MKVQKQRKMIICLTTEVILSEKPAEVMNVDFVYVMNFIRKSEEYHERETIYHEALDATINRLNRAEIPFKIYNEKNTLKFEDMITSLYEILIQESKEGSYVFINISGSTPEFAAASSIISMMFKEHCQLFSVGIDNEHRTIDLDSLRKTLIDGETGEFVGSTKSIKGPYMVNGFEIEKPNERFLKQLKLFSSIPLGLRTNSNVIRNLIYHKLWKPSRFYDGNESPFKDTSVEFEEKYGRIKNISDPEYKKKKASESVIYQKSFINKWEEGGWIYKNREITGNKYALTEKAEEYLRRFCSDRIYHIDYSDLILK